MATTTESNPPARDKKSLSSITDFSLEKTILRRGLATPNEIEMCKSHMAKQAAKGEECKGLLEIMVEAKVLTKAQSTRLLKEVADSTKKLEIPGYQILDKLGKGSMGVVYKARQASVDRIVAVKILLESLAQNREYIKRFDREAKNAAKLSHNNIVNAIDAGEVDVPRALVAATVKVNEPTADGVPDKVPVEDKTRPPGKVPLARLHV